MRMKKIVVAILVTFICSLANAQTYPTKPDYVGHIEYTKGNFGTYNYPMKGDSILVYLKDSTVDFMIFSKESHNPRNLEISAADLKQVKKKVFENITAPDNIFPTGNYDTKYACTNSNSYSNCTLYITHYGDGDIAEMTLIGESGGARLNDLFIATLIKFK
jgi:hypothetical protein